MKEIDKRIQALCEQKRIQFFPWQYPQRPWNVADDEPNTEPPGSAAAIWHDQCVALRLALKAELARG